MIFRTAAALVLSTWGTVAPAAPGARAVYAVVRVGSALADEDRVGARRAGLVCLPDGPIRWRDIATGGVMDQREIVQDALEDAGLPVTPLGSLGDRAGRPALRLRATVRTADFRVCARHYPGDARAFSGDVALDVEWRVESAADDGEVPHLSHVTRHVDASRAASLGSLYRQSLGDAARDVARWLLAPRS